VACESSRFRDRELAGNIDSTCIGILQPREVSWTGVSVADRRAATLPHLSLPKHILIPNRSTPASYRKARVTTKSMVTPGELGHLVTTFGIPLVVVETRQEEMWSVKVLVGHQLVDLLSPLLRLS